MRRRLPLTLALVLLGGALVLAPGAQGSHAIVGPNAKVTNDNNKPRFTVTMTKDQLKAAQAYDLNEKTGPTGTSTAPSTDRTR